MKKLTAIFITFLFAYTGFSQSHFRVQAGPVFSYLNAEGASGDYSNVSTGFTFGAAYEMVVTGNFSIQPELNFTHLNAAESISSTDVKFDYIQIPVLLKGVNNNRNFSVYLGPQLGFLTKGTLRQSGNSTDIKDDLTQTDFAAAIGIEYILKANITLNARYTHGLSNVYKAEFDSPNTTRHQVFSFTVGYVFTKKK